MPNLSLPETVLVREVPDALQHGTAVLGHEVFVEHRKQGLVETQGRARLRDGGLVPAAVRLAGCCEGRTIVNNCTRTTIVNDSTYVWQDSVKIRQLEMTVPTSGRLRQL